MRNIFFILFIPVLISLASCEEDNSKPYTTEKTNFSIEGKKYLATHTNIYLTDCGRIVESYGDNFQLYIVLSDALSTSFEITDALTGVSENKARSILKIGEEYYFSTAGTIDVDKSNKTGTCEISFGNIHINEGILHTDSIKNKPIIDFTRIFGVTVTGDPTSVKDPNDWIIRSDFHAIERLIFNESSKIFQTKEMQIVGFPNPFYNNLYLSYVVSPDEQMDLFLVNENFEIEKEFLWVQAEANNIVHLLNHPDFKGHFYRLYYKISSGDKNYYGSGDLEFKSNLIDN